MSGLQAIVCAHLNQKQLNDKKAKSCHQTIDTHVADRSTETQLMPHNCTVIGMGQNCQFSEPFGCWNCG